MSGFLSDRAVPMPGQVTAVRVLLFVLAGLTAVLVVAFLASQEVTAESVGRLLLVALPVAVGLVVAVRIPRGGRVPFWSIVAISGLLVLVALAKLGGGDPTGLTSLVLPGAILVLVTRRPARDFFLR
jgi:hypothetical protein